jgi:membrane associated rhomboid family serine protease
VSARRGGRFGSLNVTQGAMIVFGLELGLSLVFLMLDRTTQLTFAQYTVATGDNVVRELRLWTLVTSVFLQQRLLGLILHGFVLFMFVPTLERFWGTARFYRFFAITSLVGTSVGCLAGYLIGGEHATFPINGLDPFIYASMIAFGIVYARQPVQFFGVLPLTGRQLMYGFIVFLTLFVGLQQYWALGAAFAAAMLAAAIMTSKKWSPGLAWRRWRIARARAKLSVIEGGMAKERGEKKKRDEQKWLN